MNAGARNEDILGRSSNTFLPKSLLCARWDGFEKEFGRHRNCRFQTEIDRTLLGEDPVNAIGGLPVSLLGLKPQSQMNAADHEYIVFQCYLAQCFPHQMFA